MFQHSDNRIVLLFCYTFIIKKHYRKEKKRMVYNFESAMLLKTGVYIFVCVSAYALVRYLDFHVTAKYSNCLAKLHVYINYEFVVISDPYNVC